MGVEIFYTLKTSLAGRKETPGNPNITPQFRPHGGRRGDTNNVKFRVLTCREPVGAFRLPGETSLLCCLRMLIRPEYAARIASDASSEKG